MIKNVLVVDDDTLAADTKVKVIQVLGKGDFNAEVVYGGQACLDRLEKSPLPDMILLDLNMPTVSGADVIRAILKSHQEAPLKILPMTAWGEDWLQHWNLTDLSQTTGYRDLVWHETYDKGTNPQDLLARMRRALSMD